MKKPTKKKQIEDWVRERREKRKRFPTAVEIAERFEVTVRYATGVLAELREELKP